MLKQLNIALDQLLNVFIYIPGDGFGYADETISARAWRLRDRSRAFRIIDMIFFWSPDHCMNSYLSELKRRQLPKEYQ